MPPTSPLTYPRVEFLWNRLSYAEAEFRLGGCALNDTWAIYISFLLRMWRVSARRGEEEEGWQYEIEHIQSGRRWYFASWNDVLTFLTHVVETDGRSLP